MNKANSKIFKSEQDEGRKRIFRALMEDVARQAKTPVVFEYRFHPTRRWRFDCAFPERMVALEIEGGVWVQGRHNRPCGFEKDRAKYNEAALMGWMVLKTVWKEIQSGKAAELVGLALFGEVER